MDVIKTSESDFEIFKKEALRWIDILGLKDFEINFSHSDKIVGDGNAACVQRNCNSRIVNICLCETWPDKSMSPYNEENIKLAAFEEVLHILLYLLSSCAYSRFVMEHEIEEAEHRIIRVLQNTMYLKYIND